MAYSSLSLAILSLLCFITHAHSQTLTKQRPSNESLSAIFIFGDSTVDPGNNNYIATIFKSNFPPYGRNFVNHTPTGRFTNGRLVTDFIDAKLLFFKGVISLPQQLEFFREWKTRVELVVGKKRTEGLIKKAAFVISAGTNDFMSIILA
ncbi:hypothetical protein RJ639_011744 [Escallonia herrerae]|uniref:GDSL esterase/lipase n=1 Tax=Escallonia herrerae TaxID=1293975 RepID=A0AA88VLF8_9ASTE|nr:hypothetical protein RJ639_011744 [Escallonia herrerae]